MPRKGRPPKPAEARRREGGTARQGTISHRPQAEIVVVAGRNVPVDPPADLPDEAIELWEEIVRVLADAGIVDTIDLPMLRQLVLQYARARQATKIIDEPLTPNEEAALLQELREGETIANGLKTSIAQQLRAGVQPPPAQVNALANYEQTLTNKRAYVDARRKVGGLVALGSTGQLVEHPMVGTERAAASLLLRFASDYAMTPVARASLGIAVLEGRSLKKELEDDIGPAARRAIEAAVETRGRKPRKKKPAKE